MNGTGLISWTEFLAATIEVIGTIGEEEFDECFDRLDCDSSGYISTQVSSRLFVFLLRDASKDVSFTSVAKSFTSEFKRDCWRFTGSCL